MKMKWIKALSRLKIALGTVCYYTGIDALFYWLNRNVKRVVTYHNILPDDLCAKLGSMPVAISESQFRKQIHEMKRFLKIDADLNAKGTLTITFDDGYLNQYEIAPRALLAEGVKEAVVFVSNDVLNAHGANSALWADRELHGPESWFWRTCFLSTEDGREYVRLRLTGMSLVQMAELRSKGWKIGYHTKSHRRLSDLSYSEKEAELRMPGWLQDKIISYPFGWGKDVDLDTVAIAEHNGYDRAYSNQCENDGRACRFFLPRTVVMDDKYWLHFELSGAKYFFKNFKLLPRV